MSRTQVAGILDELRGGKLREIGQRLARLSAAQRRAVSREACRRLDEIAARKKLSSEHRWLITALQLLAPPEAGDVLTRTLAQAMHLDGCCGCTLNRTMRAVGAIGPPRAIPVLVAVIREAEHPRHKHLAAVCIEKIVESGGTEAEAILSRQTDRLQAALSELEEEVAVTKRVTPRRAWEHPPGSPGWRAASRRAAKAVARLLA